MSWINKKEKAEQRAKLVEDAGKLLKVAHSENRELTKEENEQFEKLHQDADKLYDEIRTIQKQEKAEKSLEERIGKEDVETPEKKDGVSTRAFSKWIRHGNEGLTPEERTSLNNFQLEMRTVSGLSSETDSSGGYFVAEDFANTYVEKLKAFGGIREAGATVLVTTTGSDLPVPSLDDTSNTGELTAENSAVTDDSTYDPTFGSVTLQAYMYDSKVVRCPLQLLQDSAFPVESWLADMLATRIGRITNTHFTTGTGSGQVRGVVTASTLGTTAASATAVTYNEILALKHAVDPAYRATAKFMFNDTTLLAVKKLTDGNGNPLWNRGEVSKEQPPTIDGNSYVINQDMADIGSAAKPILYGDFSYYWVRDVSAVQMLRLVERYAEYLQVGFLSFSRHDGDLVNSSAIKYLLNATSA